MLRARLAAAAASRMQQNAAKDASAEPLTLKKQRGMRTAELLQEHGDLLASLTPEQLQQLRRAFLAFADHETQLVPASQLGPLLRSVGDAPRLRDLQSLHDALGVDDSVGGAGYVLDFAEFTLVLALRTRHLHSIGDVVEAFRIFDPDNSGEITSAAFRDAMTQLTAAEDAADVEELLAEAEKISAAEDDRRKELKLARAAARAARAAALAAAAGGRAAASRLTVTTAAESGTAQAVAASGGLAPVPAPGHLSLDMGIGPQAARAGAKVQLQTGPLLPAAAATGFAASAGLARPLTGVSLGIGPELAATDTSDARAAAAADSAAGRAAAGTKAAAAATGSGAATHANGATSPPRAQRIYYELVARTMFSF